VTFGKEAGIGLIRDLRPDILNFTKGTYLEIKPLSLRGIAHGVAQLAWYEYSLGDAGFRRELEWKPPRLLTIDVRGVPKVVVLVNVEGLILYSDERAALEELVAVTSVAAARAFLRSPRALASAIGEFGRVARLVNLSISARSYQVGQQVGAASLVAAMGGF
jgi:hypothetical protein